MLGWTETFGVTGRLRGPATSGNGFGRLAPADLISKESLDGSSATMENFGRTPSRLWSRRRRCRSGEMSSLSVWLESGVEKEVCSDCGALLRPPLRSRISMARLGIPALAIMFSRSGQDKWAAVREMSFLDSSSRHLSSGDRDIFEEELVADPFTPEVSEE